MRDHLAALAALVPYPTHLVYVAGEPPTYPYVLLWPSTDTPTFEDLSGRRVDVDALVGVTCVATTPEQLLTVRAQVRTALDGAVPAVAGRWCHPLEVAASQPPQVDRDHTVPATNQHPLIAVDLVRFRTEPA